METWAAVKAQALTTENMLSSAYMTLIAAPAGSALSPLTDLVAGRRLFHSP